MRIMRIVAAPLLLGVLLILAACTGSPAAVSNTPSAPAAAEQPAAPAPVGTPAATVPPTAQTTPNTTVPPAGTSQFVVSDLKITPNGMRLGELTTVTVNVTNIGKTTATYTAVLKVKPAWAEAPVRILPQASQDVTLGPGESTIVTYQTGVMGNGAVVVSIEDQSDRFTVDSQI